MQNDNYPVAVIGDGRITTRVGSRPYPTASITNVIGLAQIALAASLPLRAIWIMPDSDVEAAAEHPHFWIVPNADWNVFSTGSMGGYPSAAVVRRNASGPARREVTIYSNVAERWAAYDMPGHEALLEDITAYERAMCVQTQMSPASTAIKLLIDTNSGCDRAAWISPLSREAIDSVPWPANRAPGHCNPRPRNGKYVHVFDKKSAYMASAVCKVGRGDPVQYCGDTPWGELVRKEIPGLWRITAHNDHDNLSLPSPFNTHSDVPDDEWYYTPQVKLALEMGWEVNVHDAWIWHDYHLTLKDWVQRLWQARQMTKGTPAEAMIKASFTQSLGVMSRRPGASEKLQRYHRPDWVGLLTAQHYLRQVKQIMKLEECCPGYLAVSTDSIAWISDEADHVAAMSAGWMGQEGAMGQYRHIATYGGAQAQSLIGAAREGSKAAKLYKMMEAWDQDDDISGASGL